MTEFDEALVVSTQAVSCSVTGVMLTLDLWPSTGLGPFVLGEKLPDERGYGTELQPRTEGSELGAVCCRNQVQRCCEDREVKASRLSLRRGQV